MVRTFRGRLARFLLALAFGLAATAHADEADEADDLSGFEEDLDFEVDTDIGPGGPAATKRWWDIDGSVAISSSWNYFSHRSAAPPPNGTDYTGLSRLRTRLNLQLDFDLPRQFKMRVTPYAWYDFTYLIHGIGSYTDRVIDEYEWEVDFQDSYLQGPILENLDLKIGRQVVNWGRSETLRVIDVLNPLDNREPGRADIEDLRWAIGMIKLDYYEGPWTVTAIAIPEMRFEDLPPVGSDFNPLPSELLDPSTNEPNSFEDWEFAAAVRGIFEGWDVSAHFAWIYEDIPTLRAVPPGPGAPFGLVEEHSRLWMVGAGGNYTLGSWLVKGELAWLDGFHLTSFDGTGFTTGGDDMRLDAMVGLEFYGLSDHSFAVEVMNRHLFGHDGVLVGFPTFQRRDSTAYAIRWTGSWMNARLSTTVLAILLGYKVQDGVVTRLQGDYTIRDGLVLTAGLLVFQRGDLPPLSDWGLNDRVFLDLKWSF